MHIVYLCNCHFDKGAFTIYVYKFSHIFDYSPTSVYNFYDINVYKFSRFLTTHPPSIINVNCERLLSLTWWPLLLINKQNPEYILIYCIIPKHMYLLKLTLSIHMVLTGKAWNLKQKCRNNSTLLS